MFMIAKVCTDFAEFRSSLVDAGITEVAIVLISVGLGRSRISLYEFTSDK